MTVPSRGWVPLPECSGCGRATRRSTHGRLGGYCSECHRTAHPVTQHERLELRDWQTTVARIRRAEAERAADRAARRQARKR